MHGLHGLHLYAYMYGQHTCHRIFGETKLIQCAGFNYSRLKNVKRLNILTIPGSLSLFMSMGYHGRATPHRKFVLAYISVRIGLANDRAMRHSLPFSNAVPHSTASKSLVIRLYEARNVSLRIDVYVYIQTLVHLNLHWVSKLYSVTCKKKKQFKHPRNMTKRFWSTW